MSDETLPEKPAQENATLLQEAHAVALRLIDMTDRKPREVRNTIQSCAKLLSSFARQDTSLAHSLTRAMIKMAATYKPHLNMNRVEHAVLPLVPTIARISAPDASKIVGDLLEARKLDPRGAILRKDFMRSAPDPGSGHETWFIPHGRSADGRMDILAITKDFKGSLRELSAEVVSQYNTRHESFKHYDCVLAQAEIFRSVAEGMMKPKDAADYAGAFYGVKFLTFGMKA